MCLLFNTTKFTPVQKYTVGNQYQLSRKAPAVVRVRFTLTDQKQTEHPIIVGTPARLSYFLQQGLSFQKTKKVRFYDTSPIKYKRLRSIKSRASFKCNVTYFSVYSLNSLSDLFTPCFKKISLIKFFPFLDPYQRVVWLKSYIITR